MEFYVFRALCKMGCLDNAIKRLKNRYSTMLSREELTTLSEYFHIGNGSVNHAWGGWIPVVMAEDICGIRALMPGFKKFIVSPNLNHLEFVDVGFESPYGMIGVNVCSSSIDVLVPDKTEAHLVYKNIDEILSSGKWHFDIKSTDINENHALNVDTSDAFYNLLGQRVDRKAKGIIVKGKKKFVFK